MVEGICNNSSFISRFSWQGTSPPRNKTRKAVIGNEMVIVNGNNIDLGAAENDAWFSPGLTLDDPNESPPDFLASMFRKGYDRYYKSSIR
ncbi:MAG: hypothetical protein ABIJ26_06615 [Candidatus Margulisiibacteriota bacterium]|nr:hypothetical protein [Candidatus Margulisiibacteriota bacterium]